MLTEMDGLESLNDVVVIAATNRPDIVDPALLRQGRFDRIILTQVPNEKARVRIFEIYTKKMKLAVDVDIVKLASEALDYVGSDIEGVCREAAMIALREDIEAKNVRMEHFEKALDVVHPSVDKETKKIYEDLKEYFSKARSKEIVEERVSYVG
jgi:transitional endoplasmic reticulum ATPase